jgi:hypothetical protein
MKITILTNGLTQIQLDEQNITNHWVFIKTNQTGVRQV